MNVLLVVVAAVTGPCAAYLAAYRMRKAESADRLAYAVASRQMMQNLSGRVTSLDGAVSVIRTTIAEIERHLAEHRSDLDALTGNLIAAIDGLKSIDAAQQDQIVEIVNALSQFEGDGR